MTSISKKLLSALYVCGAAIPLVANATGGNKSTQSGFEFGVGAGGSELDLSIPDTSGSTSLGDATYNAFAGYRINRWAAVEASYLYGGSFKKETAEVLFKTAPNIATATGMGILPITQDFSLFGRAGLAHWWYTTDFGVAGVGSVSFREKSNELIWGGGMSLFVDRGLLRLEYAQSKASPDFAGTTFDFKLRMLTLSVAWML